jgi:hypothetical protein
MKAAIFISVVLSVIACTCLTAQAAEIELNDGSILHGEIILVENDFYTLKSDILGTIMLEKSRIRNIRFSPGDTAGKDTSALPSPATSDPASRIKAFSEAMVSDQRIVDELATLSSDPDVVTVMQDPEIIRAISAGDVATLMTNDKFLKLLNNPTVQSVMRKVPQ